MSALPSTQRPPVAGTAIGVVLVVDAGLWAATVNQYGYHRDELYFRLLSSHPAWGYVDQPPFTPMTARLGIAVLGDNLWALRVPAMLFGLATVVVVAMLARELGGGPPAQLLAAAGASSTFVLIAGHVLLTATPDLVVWLLVLWCAARALLADERRWWLGAGAASGLGLYDKQLVLLLLVGIGIGLLTCGPRRLLVDRWVWAGAGLAVLLAAPTLVWQAQHGWPELSMARAISAHKGPDDRILFVPLQLVLLGLGVVPMWVAGLVQLVKRPQWRPVRALAVAYPVTALITVATGGQPYYTGALLLFLYAAGCVVTARWAAEQRRRWAWAVTAVAFTVAVAIPVALPVIPVRSLPPVIAAINQTARDSVGWPAYVQEVADVYRSLPASDRARAVLLAGNYGEAGALNRFGPGYQLPAVYSGQNQLYQYGPPPATATVVVVVGIDDPAAWFMTCSVAARLDNRVNVSNEEQGRTVQVCRQPRRPWPQLWPSIQHYD